MYHHCAIVMIVAACIASAAHASCPADINGDGEVNVDDLLLVLNNWGPCRAPCPADITESGLVNADDLVMLLNAWGECAMTVIGGLLIETEGVEHVRYDGVPANLLASDFTVIGWLEREGSGTFRRHLGFDNSSGNEVIGFRVSVANRVQARIVTDGEGGGNTSTFASFSESTVNKRTLIAYEWDATAETLKVHGVMETSGTPEYVSNSTAVTGDVRSTDRFYPLGYEAGGPGRYGGAAIRMRKFSEAEMIEMFSEGAGHTPLTYKNTDLSESGALGFNYGIVQVPGEDGVTAVNGARIGSTVQNGNYLISDGDLIVARPVTVTGSMTYEYDTSFSFTVPDVEAGVAGPFNDALHRWANDNPASPTIIATIGNSRNVRQQSFAAVGDLTDEPHGYAGSQHNALLFKNVAKCGGNLNVLPHLGSGRRHVGFEGVESPVTSGTVATVAEASNFNRCFFNSVSSNAGPGRPISLAANAEITYYAEPLAGSNFLADDNDWRLGYTILRYPGSQDVIIQSRESNSRTTDGSGVGTGTTHQPDTTVDTHTFDTGSDSYNSGTGVLSVPSAVAATVSAGDAIYNRTQDDLVEVESVDGGDITLRHAFASDPVNGDELHFGPIGYIVALEDNPVSALDHRGVKAIAQNESSRGPAIIGGLNMRTAESGSAFIYAQMGWGANGARDHLDESFAEAIPGLLDAYNAELAVVFDPYQNSTIATDFPELAEKCEEADSIGGVAFIIGQANQLAAGQESSYRTWALGQTTYTAVCVTDDERIGDQFSQIAYSGLQNTSHPSTECYERVMLYAAELIAEELTPPQSAAQATRSRNRN